MLQFYSLDFMLFFAHDNLFVFVVYRIAVVTLLGIGVLM